MEKFLEDVTTTYWWIAVVIVGIITNVASTYIRNGLENQLGKFSTYWSNKKDVRRKKRDDLLSLLKENEKALLLYAKTENQLRVRALQNQVYSFMFFFTGTTVLNLYIFDSVPFLSKALLAIVMMIFSIIMIIMSLSDIFDAIKVKINIKEAFPEAKKFNT